MSAIVLGLVLAASPPTGAAPPAAFTRTEAFYPRIRYAPSGRQLVMVENTHRVTAWDAATGRELWSATDIHDVWFGPGRAEALLLRITPPAAGQFVRVAIDTGRPTGDFKPPLPLSAGALNQTFDPAAGRAAWLRYPGPFRKVERASGGIASIENEGPTHLVVSDTATGRRLSDAKVADRHFDVQLAGLAPGGRRVAVKSGPRQVVGRDGWFRVYDAANGTRMWEAEDERWTEYPALEFAPNGRSLAVFARNEKWQTLAVRDTDTGKVLHTPFHAPATGFLRLVAVRWSADGKRIGAVIRPVGDRKPLGLTVWEAATGKRVWDLPDAWDAFDLAFSPDGGTLAVVTFGGAVVLLDAATGVHRPLPAARPEGRPAGQKPPPKQG